MEDYDKIKKVLALAFMHFLDENRPEGKMCLSNGECADIEKAFNEQDWPKLSRYLDKYLIDGSSSEIPKDLEEAAEEWAENEAYGKSDAEFEMSYKGYIAGAKWQKEQWEDRFNALEEAIKKRPVHDNVKDELKEFVLNSAEYALSDDRLLALAEHFVQWQKERMMKKATEGFIFQSEDYYPKELIANYNGELKHGDKVCIIIVKKEAKKPVPNDLEDAAKYIDEDDYD